MANSNERANQLGAIICEDWRSGRKGEWASVSEALEMVVALLGILKAGGATCRWTRSIRWSGLRSCSRMRAWALLTMSSQWRPCRPTWAEPSFSTLIGKRLPLASGVETWRVAVDAGSGLRDLHFRFNRTPKGVMVPHPVSWRTTVTG